MVMAQEELFVLPFEIVCHSEDSFVRNILKGQSSNVEPRIIFHVDVKFYAIFKNSSDLPLSMTYEVETSERIGYCQSKA
jgi:hypothetical protein